MKQQLATTVKEVDPDDPRTISGHTRISWDNRISYAFILVLSLVALWLRANELIHLAGNLLVDELNETLKLSNLDFFSFNNNKIKIRPLAFLFANQTLMALHNSDIPLRFYMFFISIAMLGSWLYISLVIFRSRLAAVISLIVIGFNPVLVEFSTQIKPYTQDALTHTAVILFALRLFQDPNQRNLSVYLLVLLISIFSLSPRSSFCQEHTCLRYT